MGRGLDGSFDRFDTREPQAPMWRCAVLKDRDGLSSLSGGFGEGETPLPIPNRAVKPLSADGTWLARARESRTPPVFTAAAEPPPRRLGSRCASPRRRRRGWRCRPPDPRTAASIFGCAACCLPMQAAASSALGRCARRRRPRERMPARAEAPDDHGRRTTWARPPAKRAEAHLLGGGRLAGAPYATARGGSQPPPVRMRRDGRALLVDLPVDVGVVLEQQERANRGQHRPGAAREGFEGCRDGRDEHVFDCRQRLGRNA